MAKTKIVVAVLLCMVGFFLVTSCSKPKHVLRIDVTESGYVPVDVANWIINEVDSTFEFMIEDEDAEFKAYYMEPANGMPTYPSTPSVHLSKYTVEWKDAQTGAPLAIATTTGALDIVVESDLEMGSGVPVAFLLMPAISKDTCIALMDLRCDPEGGVYFNGQVLAKAKLTVEGYDMLTDEEVKGETQITVGIADYYDVGQGWWGN